MSRAAGWSPAHNLPWLYVVRALRSLSTACLTVVFPLYLAKEGMGAASIGLIVSLSGLVSVALVLGVGFFADRFGRRRTLLGLSVLSAAGGFLLAWAPLGILIAVVASGLGGVGRGGGAGSGGNYGPVIPAEQPLLAAAASDRDRTRVFGIVSFVGVLAGAAGSLLAGAPGILGGHSLSLVAGYRLLFAASGVVGVAMLLATLPVREVVPAALTDGAAAPSQAAVPFRELIGKLAVTNGLNGLGIGFLGPVLTYWFYRRFGVGAAEIGVLYAVINLASAMPYLGSASLARRLGAVRTVVITRLTGVAALLAMPFLPSFFLVGLAYALRICLNSLGMPARQSFTMAVSDERYRGRVAALGSLPSQVTSLVTPAVAGAVMDSWLSFPLFGAAVFIAANAVSYHFAFHRVRVPGEAPATPSEHEVSGAAADALADAAAVDDRRMAGGPAGDGG